MGAEEKRLRAKTCPSPGRTPSGEGEGSEVGDVAGEVAVKVEEMEQEVAEGMAGVVDGVGAGEEDGEVEVEEAWPALGVRVVVGVEDILHAARTGEAGVSEGRVDGEEVLVQLSKTLVPVRIPLRLLVPEGKVPRRMKTWDKVSDEVLREMLGSLGVGDPMVKLEEGTAMRLAMWGDGCIMGCRPMRTSLRTLQS